MAERAIQRANWRTRMHQVAVAQQPAGKLDIVKAGNSDEKREDDITLQYQGTVFTAGVSI